MKLTFVPATFYVPGHSRFRAPALSRRRAPLLSVPRKPAAVQCCVESPESPGWKQIAVDVDFAKDRQLQVLEDELDSVLAEEDFTSASKVRDKLLRLQSGAYVSVLSTNLKLYNAFQNGSIVDMAGVWLQDGGVTCKHPLGPLVIGYVNIINSFGALFSYGLPNVTAKNIVITMRGSCAWLTCDEHCDVVEEEEKMGEGGKKFVETRVREIVMSATNIFAKRNGQWYICHHSAQPIYKER